MASIGKYVKPAADPVLTLLYWVWFTLGFALFFLPFQLWSALFSKERQRGFQKLNHLFYRSFFRLVRTATPGLKIDVDQRIFAFESAIIVSNHVSYLDPILLISLFERQKTIVKSAFFGIPFFGWILKQSGYIPSTTDGKLGELMLERVENLPEYLAAGGVFFVFPEGRRSLDGTIGEFNRGVFKIAKKCREPIKVLYIRNTDRLFRPGKFLFDTCVENTIRVEYLGEVLPGGNDGKNSISETIAKVRSMMKEAANENPGRKAE